MDVWAIFAESIARSSCGTFVSPVALPTELHPDIPTSIAKKLVRNVLLTAFFISSHIHAALSCLFLSAAAFGAVGSVFI